MLSPNALMALFGLPIGRSDAAAFFGSRMVFRSKLYLDLLLRTQAVLESIVIFKPRPRVLFCSNLSDAVIMFNRPKGPSSARRSRFISTASTTTLARFTSLVTRMAGMRMQLSKASQDRADFTRPSLRRIEGASRLLWSWFRSGRTVHAACASKLQSRAWYGRNSPALHASAVSISSPDITSPWWKSCAV